MFKNETVTMPTINNKKDTQVISFDGVQDIWTSNVKHRPNKIKIDGINYDSTQKKPLFLLIRHIGKKIWYRRPPRLMLTNFNEININIPSAPRNIDRNIHRRMSLFSTDSPNSIQLFYDYT